MYEAYWQLREPPFDNAPNPKFFYQSPEHEEALVALISEQARPAGVAVLAGSMPEGVAPALYPRLIAVLRERGVPIVLDAAEPYLTPALQAGVDVVKPNRAELARWAGEPIPDAPTAARAAHRSCGVAFRRLTLSLGTQGHVGQATAAAGSEATV